MEKEKLEKLKEYLYGKLIEEKTEILLSPFGIGYKYGLPVSQGDNIKAALNELVMDGLVTKIRKSPYSYIRVATPVEIVKHKKAQYIEHDNKRKNNT